MVHAADAIAVILATGSGEALQPLTANRTAAAVPFGGNFRIIDFPLTNCLNSGLRKVLVLTQYKSHSLHKHLRDGWSVFNAELDEFITPVPPQMRGGNTGYRGPLDALGQNLYLIERNTDDAVVILGGDEIYRMDYAAMLRFHRHTRADVTLACMGPNICARPAGSPLLRIDAEHRVLAVLEEAAVLAGEADESTGFALGVAVLSRTVLARLLADTEPRVLDSNDFVREALAHLLGRYALRAYRFGGRAGRVKPDRYWCRPANPDDYYRANMELLLPEPPIDLYQRDWPIRTYQSQVPPARTAPGKSCNEGVCVNSIVAAGSVIAGGGVNHSILFPGVQVHDAAIVEDSILLPGVTVGEGAHVRRCVIDKHVAVPPGTCIGGDSARDAGRFSCTPGGVVVITGQAAFAGPTADA
ncbi:MAG: glucose-1-phosphate adenylyltransferase [Gammaproteobacteria bacterium]|nr:glucose-1-phosphate adenylyltransferase [Gammaproteobacteria bacterium]